MKEYLIFSPTTFNFKSLEAIDNNLVNSMPRRIKALIEAEGDYTIY